MPDMSAHPPNQQHEYDPQSDLRATVAARRELGREMEDPLIEGFLARLDQHIDARVDQQVQQRAGSFVGRETRPGFSGPAATIVPMLGISIPLLAIAGASGGIAGTIAVMAADAIIAALVFVDRWRH